MVVDEVRKALGLVRDDGQEAAAQIFGEDDVIAREGLGGAADRCDRSSQLMETVAMKSVLSSSSRRSSVRSRNA